MSIKVKGFLKDVGGASRVTEARRKSIETASSGASQIHKNFD